VGDARVVEAEVARLERQGDPELALERASRALAAGDPARAGRILDAALAQRSQDARLLLARGDAALAAGDLARAEAAWAQVEGPRAEEARARVWVARALPAEEGALGEAWAARVACAATADEASCLLSALKPHPQLAGELERVLRRSSEAWPAGAEAALIEAGALGACDVDARLAALQAGGCEGSPEAVFRAAPGDARALDALIAWGERCGRLDPLWPARRAGLTDAVGP
jgi:tetratricopeptide (TPR) repeat protein